MTSKPQTLSMKVGRLWRHGFVTLLAVAFGGCGLAPRTVNPIPSIAQPPDGVVGKTLVVMLPGRGDRADSFQKAGFLKRIEGANFDVVAVDAHLGYYKKRSLIPRLHDDVILPAKNRGYEHIWLLGVSMGGMGSLLYSNEHMDMVDGLILLAPYLGDPGLVTEIEASGGLADWSGEDSQFLEHEVAIWEWLKKTRSGPRAVPVYLGYGTSDRFAGNYSALQGKVDGIHIVTEEGGHKWATWSVLWSRIAKEITARR